MRSAIFDLDGTLVDTSADLLAAANAVFESWSMGSPLGEGDEIIAFGGGRAMLRMRFDAVPAAETAALRCCLSTKSIGSTNPVD